MRHFCKILFLFFFFTNSLVFSKSLFESLDNKQYKVNKITIVGNEITKEKIILRELSFTKDDLIKAGEIDEQIKSSKSNLTNLNLFNFITIKHEIRNEKINFTIELIERWYIWPYPIFEISERNFNVWWQDFKESDYTDFSRLNYGLFLNIENFRGLNELLLIKFRKGFKEHYMLRYETPYINNKKTIGINTHIELFRRKKTYYKTLNNQLVYFENNNNSYTSNEFLFDFEFIYKKNTNIKHQINFDYHRIKIDENISILNPNYLLNENDLRNSDFYKLSYQFINEKRNSNIYPTSGYYLNFEFGKNMGTHVNHFEINSHIEKHLIFNDIVFLGSSLKSRITNSKKQAYFSAQTLGFDDYVRGYEYYVIDGEDFYLSKSALKYAIVKNKKYDIPYIKMKQFKKSHFSIYATLFSDIGYTKNNTDFNNNSLSNSILWGKGLSIDYVTYYDKLLRIEFSINGLGEKGVFLHFSNPFGETNKR